ncbi:serine hydrolase domain-containing protein [Haploplasma modicum]|uniref:serine hydrolase domain-containing protein n=1 Tax=Haploplasma modicum TaxID=2150 RepID=UPI00214CB25D|nr:serine hydrolase domain-containing protein [Haploplasma modicum]MCR1809135.1 beta-lactamase family protein [Haploplasma modicum]
MIEKIKEILNEGVLNNNFPGATFCLVEDGSINCSNVGSISLLPEKKPNSNNTIYDIASLSKVVSTTTLILQAISEGKIDFNTKVCDILAKYKHKNTTIQDLLFHTSGLGPVVQNASKIDTKEKLIKQIFTEELSYEPKSSITYSDTGFMILGFIIEKIYGRKIDAIAFEKIFNKIKMSNTSYRPNSSNIAPTELDYKNKQFLIGTVHDERARLLDGLSGHAGVFSTSYDLALFIKSILEDEKLLTNSMKNLIFNTKYINKDLKDNTLARSYGYNLYPNKVLTNDELIMHTGFTGCNLWIDRKEKRGFVLLSNGVHPTRDKNNIFESRKRILNLFYKS